jgi:beta-lactamase regulating signal transducer with metallopeptidase domain
MTLERVMNLAGAALTVTLVRGLVVFLAAFTVMSLWRKLAAESRHLVWLGVIAGFLLIPLAWLALPAVHVGVRIPILPAAANKLAAAPALSFAQYAQLVDRAATHASIAGQSVPLLPRALLPILPAAWLAGVAAFLVRLAIGRRRVARLAAQAQTDARLSAMARTMAGQWPVRREFDVLLSPACAVPLTFGVRRPVVLMPASATRWPANRLVSALGHELAHVRRRDVLTQSLAYAVCILFWFAPPVWAAFAAAVQESETCCDQQVINRGIQGPTYARHIVEMARGCRGRILAPCTPGAIRRKSMLRNRVRRILSLKPGRPRQGIGRVLRVLAICLACATPVLLLSAQAKPLLLHPSDPLFATWVNPAYDGAVIEVTARMVLSADGGEKDFRKVADSQPFMAGSLTLEAVWIDTEGDHWYKANWVGDYVPPRVNRSGYTCRCLIRVNAAGNLLDIVPGTETAYPRDLDDSQPRFGARKQYRRQ